MTTKAKVAEGKREPRCGARLTMGETLYSPRIKKKSCRANTSPSALKSFPRAQEGRILLINLKKGSARMNARSPPSRQTVTKRVQGSRKKGGGREIVGFHSLSASQRSGNEPTERSRGDFLGNKKIAAKCGKGGRKSRN